MPHDQDPEQRFLAAFLAARLGAADFDHLGHLHAGWLCLRRWPLDEAIARCCDGIARGAAALGAADKYHRTRSEALLRLMAARGGPQEAWADFLAANPELVQDARGQLARHYSAERLDSAAARRDYLRPDRLPL